MKNGENCLELEGERRENDGAFLLKNFSDVVSGGRGQRQTDRFPHPSHFLSLENPKFFLKKFPNNCFFSL